MSPHDAVDPTNPLHMAAWRRLITDATSASVVLAICNEYLNRLDERVVQRLPASCAPRRIASPVDVNAYAWDLLRPCADAQVANILHKLSAIFVEAAQRLAYLHDVPRRRAQRGPVPSGEDR